MHPGIVDKRRNRAGSGVNFRQPIAILVSRNVCFHEMGIAAQRIEIRTRAGYDEKLIARVQKAARLGKPKTFVSAGNDCNRH